MRGSETANPQHPSILARCQRLLFSPLRAPRLTFAGACLVGIVTLSRESVAQPVTTVPTATIKALMGRLQEPVQITALPNQPSQLVVVERRGHVRIINNGKIAKKDLLDIEAILSPGENPGLSGIAFPPNFTSSREVYVSYTDKQGDTIVGRFPTSESKTADEDELSVVLKVVQPNPHLHVSALAFGPEGYLYLALGDSPNRKGSPSLAQRLDSLFGKVLRLDISDPTRYKIPSDNPYAKNTDLSAPEIWASGVRNPIHISFDPVSKRAIVIDSGQDQQEINLLDRGGNYGWNLMEGSRCLAASCEVREFTPPLFEYRSAPSSHLVGGFTYNGKLFPALQGSFIFGDTGSNTLNYLARRNGTWQRGDLAIATGEIVAVGQGGDGEMYVATSNGALGKVLPH